MVEKFAKCLFANSLIFLSICCLRLEKRNRCVANQRYYFLDINAAAFMLCVMWMGGSRTLKQPMFCIKMNLQQEINVLRNKHYFWQRKILVYEWCLLPPPSSPFWMHTWHTLKCLDFSVDLGIKQDVPSKGGANLQFFQIPKTPWNEENIHQCQRNNRVFP